MAINRNKLDATLVAFFIVLNTTVYFSISSDESPKISAPSVTATPTATPAESTSAAPTAKATQKPAALEPATNLFADYTPTGVAVSWREPAAAQEIKQYIVEASHAGSPFVVVAQVNVGVSSVEFEKVDTPSSTKYRVVAVYADGKAISDISEVKGQYAPSLGK